MSFRQHLAATVFALSFLSIPAHASIVLFDDFDSEVGGFSSLNHTGFVNFDVSGGTVDVVRQGDFGLNCKGGSGSCVDLDGSTTDGGRITTKNAYAFNTGDVIRLSLDLSGSQIGTSDSWLMGFLTAGGDIAFNDRIAGFEGGNTIFGGSVVGPATTFQISPLASTFGYSRAFVSFTAGNSGSLRALTQTNSADNSGPIIDNFMLEITSAAVPEPASWALMILGFGLVGGVMRRRQSAREILAIS